MVDGGGCWGETSSCKESGDFASDSSKIIIRLQSSFNKVECDWLTFSKCLEKKFWDQPSWGRIAALQPDIIWICRFFYARVPDLKFVETRVSRNILNCHQKMMKMLSSIYEQTKRVNISRLRPYNINFAALFLRCCLTWRLFPAFSVLRFPASVVFNSQNFVIYLGGFKGQQDGEFRPTVDPEWTILSR